MPSRKKEAVDAAKATVESAEQEARHLRQKAPSVDAIHPAIRFALVLVASLALSSGLFTLTSKITLGELGRVSKHLEEWWEVAGLIGWKAVELGLAWVLGFDGRDVTAFIFLTHLPTYSLLASFYHIRPTTILLSYGITLFATSIPFILLRRPSAYHRNLSHAPAGTVANRSILQDRATTIYTTLAATSIFTVVVYLAYATILPTQLVLHFENIPDISAAHAGPAGLPILFLALVPAGCAARDFLFVSSAGSLSKKQEQDTDAEESSHEGEYLACAIYRKTWGALSTKTRVLVSRTAVLAAVLVLNTVVQLAGTVRGVDVDGATAWGAVWAAATVAVGGTFWWIEAVDGV